MYVLTKLSSQWSTLWCYYDGSPYNKKRTYSFPWSSLWILSQMFLYIGCGKYQKDSRTPKLSIQKHSSWYNCVLDGLQLQIWTKYLHHAEEGWPQLTFLFVSMIFIYMKKRVCLQSIWWRQNCFCVIQFTLSCRPMTVKLLNHYQSMSHFQTSESLKRVRAKVWAIARWIG